MNICPVITLLARVLFSLLMVRAAHTVDLIREAKYVCSIQLLFGD